MCCIEVVCVPGLPMCCIEVVLFQAYQCVVLRLCCSRPTNVLY